MKLIKYIIACIIMLFSLTMLFKAAIFYDLQEYSQSLCWFGAGVWFELAAIFLVLAKRKEG